MLVRFVEQSEIQLDFLQWHTSNNPRKQKVYEIGNNRMDANLTAPTPMGHLAKIKILEYGAIDQSFRWVAPCVPTTSQTCFGFSMLLGSMSMKVMVHK